MPDRKPQLSIVTTADRPDLVPLVAHWLWDAFWRAGGHPFETVLDHVRESVNAGLMPRTFILLAGDKPVGTASLVPHDLDERPDLTPWLAGVFVEPQARGQGYAAHLIASVEDACRKTPFTTLWLYTDTAERIYARAGWQAVETIEHRSQTIRDRIKPVVLMRRDLLPQPATSVTSTE
jgi:GNAT superfamily N-acetyltransferase